MRTIFRTILCLLSVLQATLLSSQAKPVAEEKEILSVMHDFMKAVRDKDSVAFYNLFHVDPVAWVGTYKAKTQAARLQKNTKAVSYFTDDYKSFIRGIINDKESCEEKFYNVKVVCDESIASLSFDYSFWFGGKKSNWGKESWGLLKANGAWKITSVLFSLDFENLNSEPPVK